MMQHRQLQRYGSIAVGHRVEYERLDNPLKDEPKTIRTTYTVKGIRECESGALFTLKGATSTLVQAFDVHGSVLGGKGELRVLEDPPISAVVDVANVFSESIGKANK